MEESPMTLNLKIARTLTTSALAVVLLLAVVGAGQASTTVKAGFDIFETAAPGASFDFTTVPNPQTVLFLGVPLGVHDFGNGHGNVNTGLADTIVQRMQDADISGGSDTIDIEIVALSLRSATPVDLGFGAGFEHLTVTLNTSSPSVQSQMTITDGGEGDPHGTFDSSLNLSFDVVGDIGGFYATIEQTFSSSGEDWSHDHEGSNVVLIMKVNHNLDSGGGHSHSEDFHIIDELHTGPHPVVPARYPPYAPVLGGFGIAVLCSLMGFAGLRKIRG
jgi:hypothetical protein